MSIQLTVSASIHATAFGSSRRRAGNVFSFTMRQTVDGSSGNVVENNSLTGNMNGLLVQRGATGKTIRTNVIVGNAPSQLSRTYGPIGFDIKDEAPANGARNAFGRSWCISYSGPGPSPCPSFPGVAAPTISAVTATPDVLWPPNGQLVPVTVAVTASDVRRDSCLSDQQCHQQ